MAGIIAIYGLVVAVIIAGKVTAASGGYTLYQFLPPAPGSSQQQAGERRRGAGRSRTWGRG